MADGAERQPDDTTAGPEAPARATPPAPGLFDLFLSFLRLGSVSFGGPAMVAYIKRLAVARKGWLSEDDFQRGVALCQGAPGAQVIEDDGSVLSPFAGAQAGGRQGSGRVCGWSLFGHQEERCGCPVFLTFPKKSCNQRMFETSWRRSQVVRQRSAKPSPSVRIRSAPLKKAGPRAGLFLGAHET